MGGVHRSKKMNEEEIYELIKIMSVEEFFSFAEKYYGIPRDGWRELDLEKCRWLSTEEIKKIGKTTLFKNKTLYL